RHTERGTTIMIPPDPKMQMFRALGRRLPQPAGGNCSEHSETLQIATCFNPSRQVKAPSFTPMSRFVPGCPPNQNAPLSLAAQLGATASRVTPADELMVGLTDTSVCPTGSLRVDLRPDLVAADHAGDVAGGFHVEDDQRELALHRQGDRGEIHGAELLAVD